MALKAWFLVFFLLIASHALAAEKPTPTMKGAQLGSQAMHIHVDHNRLTVKLHEAPLESVLKEIGRCSAVEISILGRLTKSLSMEFQDLPLEEGFRKLLGGYGWMLIYDGSAPQDSAFLEKVIVVQMSERAHPSQSEDALGQTRGETLVRAVATLVSRENVIPLLNSCLRGPTPKTGEDACQDLMDMVKVEELRLLIGVLRYGSVQPAEWKVALAPLSGIITSRERKFVLRSLQDQGARGSMAEMLESYLTYRTGEEAKIR